jgi:hypothetical protein
MITTVDDLLRKIRDTNGPPYRAVDILSDLCENEQIAHVVIHHGVAPGELLSRVSDLGEKSAEGGKRRKQVNTAMPRLVRMMAALNFSIPPSFVDKCTDLAVEMLDAIYDPDGLERMSREFSLSEVNVHKPTRTLQGFAAEVFAMMGDRIGMRREIAPIIADLRH